MFTESIGQKLYPPYHNDKTIQSAAKYLSDTKRYGGSMLYSALQGMVAADGTDPDFALKQTSDGFSVHGLDEKWRPVVEGAGILFT